MISAARGALGALRDLDFDPRPRELPVWFEAALAAALVGVATYGLFGLFLALQAAYSVPLVAAAAVLSAAGVAALWWWRSDRDSRSGALAATLIVVAAATLIGGFNATRADDTLLAGRDPGVYVATGLWLSNHDDLTLDIEREAFPSDIDLLRFKGPGFERTAEDGEALHAQFPHLYAVLLSFGGAVGGTTALLKVTAILGALSLLAIFAFAARLMNPWLAAIGTVGYGLSYLFAYFTRTAMSEVPTQLFLFGGGWLLLTAYRRQWLWLRLPAGLVLGATAATRADAFLLLAGLLAFLAWEVLDARRQSMSTLVRVLPGVMLTGGGALVGGAMGWIDIRAFSPFYYVSLESRLLDMRALGIAVVIGAAVLVATWPLLALAGARLQRLHRAFAFAAGLGVVAICLYTYLLRPEITTDLNPAVPGNVAAIIENLQALSGEEINGQRTYREQAGAWLGIYLGPITVIGASLALGVAFYRQLLRPSAAWVLLLFLTLPLSVLYLHSHEITPDQPWAMRRFFTVTLPAISLLFAAGAGWLMTDKLPSRIKIAGRLAAIAGLIGLIAWPVSQLPDLRYRGLHPLGDITADVCDEIGEDAAVLVHPPTGEDRELVNFLSDRYSMIVRTACDVPVASVGGLPTSADYDRMARTADDAGRRFVVVSPSPFPLFTPLPGEVTEVGNSDVKLLRTLVNDRPTAYITQRFTAYVMPVPVVAGRFLAYGRGFDVREVTESGPGRWLRTRTGRLRMLKSTDQALEARIRLRAAGETQTVVVTRGGTELARRQVPSKRFVTLAIPLNGPAGEVTVDLTTSPGPERLQGSDRRRLAIRVLEEAEVVAAEMPVSANGTGG